MSYMFVKVCSAAVLASALASDVLFNFVPFIGHIIRLFTVRITPTDLSVAFLTICIGI